jgi:hypothetical protein
VFSYHGVRVGLGVIASQLGQVIWIFGTTVGTGHEVGVGVGVTVGVGVGVEVGVGVGVGLGVGDGVCVGVGVSFLVGVGLGVGDGDGAVQVILKGALITSPLTPQAIG